MIKNFFTIALRNILRQKKYSVINITGLSIGIAISLLIFLWILDEISYDKYNTNWENTYRVVQTTENAGYFEKLARTPAPLAEALKANYPEIKKASRAYILDFEFEKNNNIVYEYGLAADEDIFDILDLKIVRGSKSKMLDDTKKIVVSDRICEKYFDGNFITDTIIKVGDAEYLISGVFEKTTKNSHLNLDFVIPFDIFYELGLPKDSWNNSNNPFYTYIQTNSETNIEMLKSKIQKVYNDNLPDKNAILDLQNIARIHLYSDYSGDISGNGNSNHVIIFSIISVLILIIASVNYMNLSVAQSLKRAKEVGLKKVVGAKQSGLFFTYLGEAILLVFLSMLLSLILAELLLPYFNLLSGKALVLYNFSNWYIFAVLIVVAVLLGMLSGFYPASILSSYQPIKVLKGVFSGGKQGLMIRKILVIFQFTVSITLIICFLTVNKQLSYMNSKDLGFNKESLFYVHFGDAEKDKSKILQQEISRSPSVKNASVSSHVISNVSHVFNNVSWEGKETLDEKSINVVLTDENFIQTMEMEIYEGKDFDKNVNDSLREIIINQQAKKLMGYKNPIGKKVKLGRFNTRIIGVVKDFHFKPLDKKVEPIILLNSNRESFYVYVRAHNLAKAITDFEQVWKKHCPEKPFEYHLQNETLEQLYSDEKKVAKIVASFTILAVFISCLGLFGLISFIVATKIKEIAIRKVLGSSVQGLLKSMNRSFLIWVLIANIIAWPVSYYLISKWLGNYAYRIDIHIEYFLYAGLISILIALLTVTLQSLEAINKNPVVTLKYE